jgi:hypothetical protein
MEASAGNVAEAISLARSTLRSEEAESRSEFKWNEYALGVIAFLEGRKEELQRHADKLAESATKQAMNAPNYASLRRLLSCFGQPYAVASTCSQ